VLPRPSDASTWLRSFFRIAIAVGQEAGLPEEKKNLQEEIDQVRELADRIEGDDDDDRAIELMEKAVETVERFGKRLEEEPQ
jgi:uncharacterized protein YpuA (DUF1002 family)